MNWLTNLFSGPPATYVNKPLGNLATLKQRVEVTTSEPAGPADEVCLSKGGGRTFAPPERTEEVYSERLTFNGTGTYIDLASGRVRENDDHKLGRVDYLNWDDKELCITGATMFGDPARQVIAFDGTTEFTPKNSTTKFTIKPDGSATITTPPTFGQCLDSFIDPQPRPGDDGSIEAGLVNVAVGLGNIIGIGLPDNVVECKAQAASGGRVTFVDGEGNLRGVIKPLLDPTQYLVTL